jgi:hypothetical protein
MQRNTADRAGRHAPEPQPVSQFLAGKACSVLFNDLDQPFGPRLCAFSPLDQSGEACLAVDRSQRVSLEAAGETSGRPTARCSERSRPAHPCASRESSRGDEFRHPPAHGRAQTRTLQCEEAAGSGSRSAESRCLHRRAPRPTRAFAPTVGLLAEQFEDHRSQPPIGR